MATPSASQDDDAANSKDVNAAVERMYRGLESLGTANRRDIIRGPLTVSMKAGSYVRTVTIRRSFTPTRPQGLCRTCGQLRNTPSETWATCGQLHSLHMGLLLSHMPAI